MKFAYALPRRWMGFAVILVVLTRLLTVVRGEVSGSEKREADAKRAAEMVNAIVNRNKAPKLVKWRGDITSWAAFFPEDHDWK